MAEVGRYVYAVARGLDVRALTVAGLRGMPLGVVEHGGLSALVSDVDLDEFGEEGLRLHLEELAWLEDVARSHDSVVQEAATQGAVAPLRLATICHDDDAVRDRLEEWHDGLMLALDRVEGRLEWSVKAYSRTARTDDASREAPVDTAGAGASYLQRKRARTIDRRTAEQQAMDLADQVHAALAEHSAASRRLPPQDPRLTGHEGTMTLNGAYLVATEDADAFVARGAALSKQFPEAGIELHGPWPPYSFATLDPA